MICRISSSRNTGLYIQSARRKKPITTSSLVLFFQAEATWINSSLPEGFSVYEGQYWSEPPMDHGREKRKPVVLSLLRWPTVEVEDLREELVKKQWSNIADIGKPWFLLYSCPWNTRQRWVRVMELFLGSGSGFGFVCRFKWLWQ